MGKLFVVGIGPGGPDGMTIAARRALEASDGVVGYTKYVEPALAAFLTVAVGATLVSVMLPLIGIMGSIG